MALEVTFHTTTYDKLDELPIVNGQIIALADRSGYYYDHANTRYHVGDINIIDSPPTEETPGSEGSIYVCIDPPGIYIYVDGKFYPVSQRLVIERVGEGNVVSDLEVTDDYKLKVTLGSSPTMEEFQAHVNQNTGNPHGVTKQDLGLGSVDNTADAEKDVRSAGKLTEARAIDGVSFDGSKDIKHFGVCDTAADTAAKTVEIIDYKLVDGAHIYVKFTQGNTATSPTLSVNSTTPSAIRYRGQNLQDTDLIQPNSVVGLLYTSNGYEISGSVDWAVSDIDPSDDTPLPVALIGDPGKSEKYARADHVHSFDAEEMHGIADKLAVPRQIALIGDVTGSAEFDGTKDIQIETTAKGKLSEGAVGAGLSLSTDGKIVRNNVIESLTYAAVNTAIEAAEAGSTIHLMIEQAFGSGDITGKEGVHVILDFSNVSSSPAIVKLHAPANSMMTVRNLTSTQAKAIEISADSAGVIVITDSFFSAATEALEGVINDLGSTAKILVYHNVFSSGGVAVNSSTPLMTRMIFENNVLKVGMSCKQATTTLDVQYNNLSME